jgi:hypothetical protein
MKSIRHYLSNEIEQAAKQWEQEGMAYWMLKVQILRACMRIKNSIKLWST